MAHVMTKDSPKSRVVFGTSNTLQWSPIVLLPFLGCGLLDSIVLIILDIENRM